jgi:hypothetical protein
VSWVDADAERQRLLRTGVSRRRCAHVATRDRFDVFRLEAAERFIVRWQFPRAVRGRVPQRQKNENRCNRLIQSPPQEAPAWAVTGDSIHCPELPNYRPGLVRVRHLTPEFLIGIPLVGIGCVLSTIWRRLCRNLRRPSLITANSRGQTLRSLHSLQRHSVADRTTQAPVLSQTRQVIQQEIPAVSRVLQPRRAKYSVLVVRVRRVAQ